MNEKAMLIDVSKCTACRGCQVACKQWYQLPAEVTENRGTYENPPDLSPSTVTRITFQETVIGGEFKWLFRKHQCMHCTDAPCVEFCPVNALYKNGFGFTGLDIEKCIGCGTCTRVCPFDVPRVDDEIKKTTKCWYCLDRVANDMEPACSKTCPTGALKFGDRDELLDYADLVVASPVEKWYLYGENELGGLHVLYLLPEAPEVYGLPKSPQTSNLFEAIGFLEKSLNGSPIKEQVLAMAVLKYFGKVHSI